MVGYSDVRSDWEVVRRKIESSSGVYDTGASGSRVYMVSVLLVFGADAVSVAEIAACASDLRRCLW